MYEVPVLIFEVLNPGRLSTQMLTKVKGTLPLDGQSNVVHCIPCSCGQVCIRETSLVPRPLQFSHAEIWRSLCKNEDCFPRSARTKRDH